MAARRAQQAKQSLASNSNLSTLASAGTLQTNSTRARLKSTSMTNLVGNKAPNSNSTGQNNNSRIQRPASRNALDNIHKGMNAKFTHVQSKVLLQNIRPQQQQQAPVAKSKIPAKPERLTPTTPSSTLRRSTPQPSSSAASGKIQLSDRSQLINKIKALQEELERHERQNDELKQELERERAEKTELVQQAKFELQERVAESERQNEEHHQKLLEAYELADQNRRAADSVLSESRQREEELRKKIDELEQQLAELREFVSMKEEMVGKMGEMREQIRAERERYEEKTRSLHQMFENEKLSNPGHRRFDQNSNYFRRTKPSLQSAESINRLDNGTGGQQRRQHYHNQSEHDIYGSKLSTRMQDGARLAWKKSRKFASSVITGSLGGISACRRHNGNNSKSSSNNNNTASSSNGHHNQGVTIMHSNGAELVGSVAAGQQHHTSVIEVGSTVGDFIAHHQHRQQPSETLATIHQQQTTGQATVFNESGGNNSLQQQQQQGLIRVDENNKLTIVTKFSEQTPASGQQSSEKPDTPELGSASSPSSERSCSEQSRCESSSSGLGTAASDSGNSCPGSHNGDHPEQPLDVQQQRDGVIKTTMSGADGREMEEPHGKPEPHQRHKRKSSLFKSSAFSGSQASLNKTFKSFFALASAKAGSLALSSANKNAEDGASPSALTAAKHEHGHDDCATPATLVGQMSSSPEVFVEPVGSGREQQPGAEPASTPTSSLKSSSLTDSDRTITGELSSSGGGRGGNSELANESDEQQSKQNGANTTTTMILNEFVRYEERPDGDENATNSNNKLCAASDDEADANELVGAQLGQGEHRPDEDKSVARFEHHHHHQPQHRAEVAVEH